MGGTSQAPTSITLSAHTKSFSLINSELLCGGRTCVYISNLWLVRDGCTTCDSCFHLLGHEIWSYAQLCSVDSEWVTSVHPPISACTFSSIFQGADEQTWLTQNQRDRVVHMTILQVLEMKKYESHIVQPSRTNHRFEIYRCRYDLHKSVRN